MAQSCSKVAGSRGVRARTAAPVLLLVTTGVGRADSQVVVCTALDREFSEPVLKQKGLLAPFHPANADSYPAVFRAKDGT